MTLGEIADQSGIPARTVRFYIARGLLDGPVKSGRDAVYTKEHVARLNRIKNLQSDGHTLSEIARLLSGRPGESGAPQPTAWWQHAIGDDIIVWVKAGASPWRTKQVRAAVEEFARLVASTDNETGKE